MPAASYLNTFFWGGVEVGALASNKQRLVDRCKHHVTRRKNEFGGAVTQESNLDPCLIRRHAVPFSLLPVMLELLILIIYLSSASHGVSMMSLSLTALCHTTVAVVARGDA